MKMKFALILFLFIAVSGTVKSQYYFYNGDYYENDLLVEFGVSAGGMTGLTDIGGRRGIGKKGLKDLNLKTTTLTGGLYFAVMFQNKIGLRVEGTIGTVASWDSILVKVAPTTNERYERNLSFKTPIKEFSLLLELHPFELFGNNNIDKLPPVVSPYLLGGVGFYHFNPMGKLNGTFIDLKPLHTEGEGFEEYPDRKEYDLNQFNIPLGFGVRYDLSPIVNIRAELLHRVLFTDYIDDVSRRYINPAVFSKYLSGEQLSDAIQMHDRSKPGAQTAHPDGIRGNPKDNDAYMTLTIKLGISLRQRR